MLKSILTGVIIIALSFGISYSSVAQPKAVKIDTQTEATTKPNGVINTKSTTDVDKIENRINMQVQRYVKDYNLTEKQQKEIISIITDFEKQSNELRTKLNSLNKEKTEKIESLLTNEQKKIKEKTLKEKRERLINKKNEEKTAIDKKETPKAVSVPENE